MKKGAVVVSKIREARKLLLINGGLDPNDVNSWVGKWSDLKQNVIKKGLVCSLTFDDYIRIVKESNIDSPLLTGQSSEQYCMARIGDIGNYEYGNCRYITQRQNQVERRTNGGLESARQKIIGRTKDTHAYIAEHSIRMVEINRKRKECV